MNKTMAPLIAVLIAATGLSRTASAGTDNTQGSSSLKTRVRKLKKRVDELEKDRANSYKVGGALRVQYVYRDWDAASRKQAGTLDFDTFRFNINGTYKGIILSTEYRFYRGWNSLKYGWMGYDFTSH